MNKPTDTRPARSGRSRDPVRTKAAILAAGREVFVEHGFTGARTSEIAKRASIPQGLIYHYFESKEVLFDAVMEDVFSPYFEGMLMLLREPADVGVSLLEQSVRMYFSFLQGNPHVPRLLAWWMADQGWENKPLIHKRNLCEEVEILGSARIRKAQEDGWIKPNLEPGFVIKTFVDLCMMWHMSKGRGMLEMALGPEPQSPDPKMDAVYLEHLVEVFLQGVTTEEYRRR